LIEIGSNVTIANNVQLITHDNSISKVLPDTSDLFGKIVIGDNCFIGARSIIMYGIELAPNTIVAAGSVVTKSFPEGNIVIGGNPAKVITTWEKFAEKNRDLAWDLSKYTREEEIRMHRDCIKLVKR
jgi:maltose O-acetyltransferase